MGDLEQLLAIDQDLHLDTGRELRHTEPDIVQIAAAIQIACPARAIAHALCQPPDLVLILHAIRSTNGHGRRHIAALEVTVADRAGDIDGAEGLAIDRVFDLQGVGRIGIVRQVIAQRIAVQHGLEEVAAGGACAGDRPVVHLPARAAHEVVGWLQDSAAGGTFRQLDDVGQIVLEGTGDGHGVA